MKGIHTTTTAFWVALDIDELMKHQHSSNQDNLERIADLTDNAKGILAKKVENHGLSIVSFVRFAEPSQQGLWRVVAKSQKAIEDALKAADIAYSAITPTAEVSAPNDSPDLRKQVLAAVPA